MASAHPLIDHDEIRRWAEARRAQPSCVRRTGGKGDPGMIRLDFPGFSGRQSLSSISWKDWFKSFDDNNLALLVQDRTARGQRSNFNKLVSRESVTEGRAPRRERKREHSGSSHSSRAIAAERRTARGKTRGRSKSERKRSTTTRRSTTGARRSHAADSSRSSSRSTRSRSARQRSTRSRSSARRRSR